MSHPDKATWLEDIFNRMTGSRWNWFPLHSMQPAANEFITTQMILTLVVLIFLPASCAGGVGMFFYVRWLGLWDEIALFGAAMTVVLTLAGVANYQYICAHFWNRRARRLQSAGDVPSRTSGEIVAGKTMHGQPNPYAAPEVVSVATDNSRPGFPLNRSLLFHEVFFCHGSLLLWSLVCFRNWLYPGNLTSVTQSYRVMGILSLLQALVLVALTVSLASRQSRLGRRTFFVLKLAFGIGQVAFVLLPIDQHIVRSALMTRPLDEMLLYWFGCCGLLTVWSAIVQYRQPENPVQPLFGSNPVSTPKSTEEQTESW